VQKLIRFCCYLGLFLLFAPFLHAQTGAEAELDSNLAETGNPFFLHLRIPKSAGQPLHIAYDAWKGIVNEQNILNQTEWTMGDHGWEKNLTLILFDADTITFPPLPIAVKGGDTLLTNALSLVVLPSPAPDDLNDMAEIKDIHKEPVLWTDYLPWILGILGCLAVFLGILWWFNRRKKPGMQSRVLQLSPHELALKKLEALRKKQLWQQGALKQYYAELTFIVREYLRERFAIPALESASGETIAQLRKSDQFPADLIPPMQELFRQADLAKFAKAIPAEDFHEQALKLAFDLVQSTIPAPLESTVHPSTPPDA
jgi:hypothetical protein